MIWNRFIFFCQERGPALSCLSQKMLEYGQFGGASDYVAHVGRQSPGMCEGCESSYQEEVCGKDSCSPHFSGLSSSADGEGEIPASGANRNKWLSVLKTAICRICISIFDSFESSIFLKIDLSLVLYTAVPNMTTNCKPACCVYVWVDACIGGDISLSNVSRSRASFTIIWSYFNFLRFFLLLFYLEYFRRAYLFSFLALILVCSWHYKTYGPNRTSGHSIFYVIFWNFNHKFAQDSG